MPRSRVPDALPLQLRLDRDSGQALHRQLYMAIRTAILDGAFAPGVRLPSSRSLASDLGVSRTTVLQAFDWLVAEGYATARAGGGTRVASTLPRGRTRDAIDDEVGSSATNLDSAPRLSRAALAYMDSVSTHREYRPIPFALGLPALDHFPTATWLRLAARRWRQDAVPLLGYTDVRGYPPLREAIARYVMVARGVRCTADQVLVVNGAQHAVDLLARLLLEPGDEAWVEEPGYRPVRAAIRATGARIVPVPVDEHGLDVSVGERRAPNARLAYVTPSYQAPLGVTLSLERRLALLAWAARAEAWVLEDDYNGEYRYDTHPIPSVQGLDRAGRVIYIGTFSKTLAPGLRIGFMVVPLPLVTPIVRARIASDLHSPVAEQAVLADFLAGGHFARHIRRTRELYRRRQRELIELAPALTFGLLDVRPAPSGMQLLCLLPPGVDARAVTRAADAAGVVVTPLSSTAPHFVTGGRGGILLGYAAFDREATERGLATLGDVLRTLVGAATAAPPERIARRTRSAASRAR